MQVSNSDALWTSNVFSNFIGKTLFIEKIEIIERNWFNTLIETAVKTSTVTWYMEEGSFIFVSAILKLERECARETDCVCVSVCEREIRKGKTHAHIFTNFFP